MMNTGQAMLDIFHIDFINININIQTWERERSRGKTEIMNTGQK